MMTAAYRMGVLVVLAVAACGATVAVDWVTTYDGPWHGWNSVRAIALGPTGDVYAAGQTTAATSDTPFDYAITTARFNQRGQVMWVRQRFFGASVYSYIRPEKVAVDAAGNMFVTAYLSSGDYQSTVGLFKYNAAGEPLWEVLYDGPGDSQRGDDQVYDLKTDAAGNAYIAGYTYVRGYPWGHYEAYVTKYAPDGTVVWHRQHEAYTDNFCGALALDADGSVYAVGRGPSAEDDEDYMLLKYSAAGELEWERYYDGSSHDFDLAMAVAVDGQGGVYVSGHAVGVAGRHYLTTLKYDREGTLLWTQPSQVPWVGWEMVLAADVHGDIVVGTTTRGATAGLDLFTLKYGADGTLKWAVATNSPADGDDKYPSMALDRHGRIYMAGTTYGQQDSIRPLSAAYAPDGNQLWLDYYGQPDGGYTGALCIAADDGGHVYVGGFQPGNDYYDFLLMRYRQYVVGDANCDGTVNYLDVDPFVRALAGINAYGATFPECFYGSADTNRDGQVNFGDIDGLIGLLR